MLSSRQRQPGQRWIAQDEVGSEAESQSYCDTCESFCQTILLEADAGPLGEKSWLGRCILGIAKVAEANANQPKALPRVQGNTVTERERDGTGLLFPPVCQLNRSCHDSVVAG